MEAILIHFLCLLILWSSSLRAEAAFNTDPSSFVADDVLASIIVSLSAFLESETKSVNQGALDARSPASSSFLMNLAFFIPIGRSMLAPCGVVLLFTIVAFVLSALSGTTTSLSSPQLASTQLHKHVGLHNNALARGGNIGSNSGNLWSTGTHFANWNVSPVLDLCNALASSINFCSCQPLFFVPLIACSACSKAAHFYWFFFHICSI